MAISIDLYKSLRTEGVPPFKIREACKRMSDRRDMSVENLISVVIGMVVFSVVSSNGLFEDDTLWIMSPTGKVVKELPFYNALRVIRKKGWLLAEVEPVEAKRRKR